MGRRKQMTAFPVARIKKIMQADEDVGKIATATPLLVSKALELVMEDLLRKSAAIATERKGKTITPQHLKECVKREECFDFLRKIFDKVVELGPPTEKKTERKTVKKEKLLPLPSVDGSSPPKRKRGRPSKAETVQKRTKAEDMTMAIDEGPTESKPSREENTTSVVRVELSEKDREVAVSLALKVAQGKGAIKDDDEDEDYDDEEEDDGEETAQVEEETAQVEEDTKENEEVLRAETDGENKPNSSLSSPHNPPTDDETTRDQKPEVVASNSTVNNSNNNGKPPTTPTQSTNQRRISVQSLIM